MVLLRIGGIRCKLQDTCHIYKLTNECLLIREVVNVIVLELEEVCHLLFLVNDNWQDLGCIQLLWSIEVHLAEKTTQGGYGS